MSIKDSYNNKKVTFDMQDGLEDKIDRLTVMMSKLAANEEGANSLNLRYIKIKEEVKQEISMTDVSTGESCLSHTAVKPDSCLAQIFL